MNIRWTRGIAALVAVLLLAGIAGSAMLYSNNHAARVVNGAALLITGGTSWLALLGTARARAETESTMGAVVTLTRWVLVTQHQLHDVRRCGDRIQRTLDQLDQGMAVSDSAPPQSVRPPRRGSIIDLPRPRLDDDTGPVEAHG